MNPLYEPKASRPPKAAKKKLLLPNFPFFLAVVKSVHPKGRRGRTGFLGQSQT